MHGSYNRDGLNNIADKTRCQQRVSHEATTTPHSFSTWRELRYRRDVSKAITITFAGVPGGYAMVVVGRVLGM